MLDKIQDPRDSALETEVFFVGFFEGETRQKATRASRTRSVLSQFSEEQRRGDDDTHFDDEKKEKDDDDGARG